MESMPLIVVETPGRTHGIGQSLGWCKAPIEIISPEPPILFMPKTAKPRCAATGSTSC